jgi:hypothetical protein
VACDFETILALLDSYTIWLQSDRHDDNLVARIGTAATVPFPQIDPHSRDQYLRLLQLYLSWCVTVTPQLTTRFFVGSQGSVDAYSAAETRR